MFDLFNRKKLAEARGSAEHWKKQAEEALHHYTEVYNAANHWRKLYLECAGELVQIKAQAPIRGKGGKFVKKGVGA